jgi:hypothetical protein
VAPLCRLVPRRHERGGAPRCLRRGCSAGVDAMGRSTKITPIAKRAIARVLRVRLASPRRSSRENRWLQIRATARLTCWWNRQRFVEQVAGAAPWGVRTQPGRPMSARSRMPSSSLLTRADPTHGRIASDPPWSYFPGNRLVKFPGFAWSNIPGLCWPSTGGPREDCRRKCSQNGRSFCWASRGS